MWERVRIIGALIIFICMIVPSTLYIAGSPVPEDNSYGFPVVSSLSMWFWETDSITQLTTETSANFEIILCVDVDYDGKYWPEDGEDEWHCYYDEGFSPGVGLQEANIDDSFIDFGYASLSYSVDSNDDAFFDKDFKIWVNGASFNVPGGSSNGYCAFKGAIPQADGTYAPADQIFHSPNGGNFDIDVQIPGIAAESSISCFDIDMWDQSFGIAAPSLLNMEVEADNTYTFFAEVNYTVDGVDQFYADGEDDVWILLTAWYDEGIESSSMPVTDDHDRTRAFSALWSEGIVPGADTIGLINPIGSPGTDEFQIDSWWLEPGPGDHYYVYMNITFGPQTRVADGNGFGNGASADINNAVTSFNDLNSWNFNIRICDANQPSTEANAYEEFGILPNKDINAAFDPMVIAPPGSIQNFAMPNSQVSLSSNQDYYLNVSITDLQRTSGFGTILASNVHVASMSPLADNSNTQINLSWAAGTAFPGADIPLGVWGNTSQSFANWMVPAPGNGTIAEGPWGSDYNGRSSTDIAWWVDVPAATVEGMYEATITYTLGTYGGSVVMDSSTTLSVIVEMPHIFDVDMWEQSDPTHTSTLNTVVPVSNTYTFRTEVNYSIGGVDQIFDGMDNTVVNITGWYDDGIGIPFPDPGAGEEKWTKQFSIEWSEGVGMGNDYAMMTYPLGSAEGFMLDSWYIEGVPWDHYYLYINVTFGSEVYAADGQEFVNGAANDIHDPMQALNDLDSWDLRVEIYDTDFPTAVNHSYEEFGVDNSTGDSFIIPLSVGWNLISLPMAPSSQSLSYVLQSIDGKWDMVMAYDAADTNHWASNIILRPDTLDDLFFIDHKMGFWINIIEPDVELMVYGNLAPSTDIQLYAGWNLVSYPTLNNGVSVADAFWGTGVSIVEVCNTTAPYNQIVVEPNYIMVPGEGYWVYTQIDTIWTVDW